jgi:hypothetical protein
MSSSKRRRTWPIWIAAIGVFLVVGSVGMRAALLRGAFEAISAPDPGKKVDQLAESMMQTEKFSGSLSACFTSGLILMLVGGASYVYRRIRVRSTSQVEE